MVFFDAALAYLIAAVLYFGLRFLILRFLSIIQHAGGNYGHIRASRRPRHGGRLFKRE